MAKIQTKPNSSKLTAAGFSSCADSLREKYPVLADVMGDEKEVQELNHFLTIIQKKRRVQLLERYTAARMLSPHSFDEMHVPLPTQTKDTAARCLDAVHPVGTMEWTFEVFPELRAHVCEFLLSAEEMEDMVRDLTAGYNFVGVDPEDLNDILTRSNQLCKKLSLFDRINEQRLRIMSKLSRSRKTRRMNPDKDQKAA